ncbi:MAG: DUF2130 domain-containing protein [Clostridia bacterium]|nr:DUF2130 domain-containing protein [Clostridia bacterium]
MAEIKCPKCGEVFQVDESGYAQIVSQVRDAEFQRELKERQVALVESREAEIKLAQAEQEKTIAERDQEITALKAQLANAETEKKLAVTEAVSASEKELTEKSAEITRLQGDIQLQKQETELKTQSLKEEYAGMLRLKDDQIEQLKDFKAKQSTKMVGESLEQHCNDEFNKIRMTAFPNAYFEKDNDTSVSGSKGDFIFREADESGTEFISIMFEMKNERDETATKHKNEDFFKELDKDRKEKGCEYAVLVSLLEADSELYNSGIVDVSYKYEKMYVIRPQLFIPMITLLRNAALNSLKYQRELAIIRNQQIDIRNFEDNMNAFKEASAKNYRIANEKFNSAIEEIDKAIARLEKVKKDLQSSENNIRLANDKADSLSIRKLTKNAPSVKDMFDELEVERRKDEEEV